VVDVRLPVALAGSVTVVGVQRVPAVTVRLACRLGPPEASVAEIVVVPADTPVATHVDPLAVTVATAVLVLAHEATADDPPGFVTVNVDCAPTLTLAVSGAMLAADVTVMFDVRDSETALKPLPVPCAVAVITAAPALTPVTTPAADTVAIALLLELYDTVTVAPAGLLMLGANGTVCPTATVAVEGAIWKLVIAGGRACTVSAAETV
jgi:hypothetical protein